MGVRNPLLVLHLLGLCLSADELRRERWDYRNQELARLVCMRKDARGKGRAKRRFKNGERERSFGVYGEKR